MPSPDILRFYESQASQTTPVSSPAPNATTSTPDKHMRHRTMSANQRRQIENHAKQQHQFAALDDQRPGAWERMQRL